MSRSVWLNSLAVWTASRLVNAIDWEANVIVLSVDATTWHTEPEFAAARVPVVATFRLRFGHDGPDAQAKASDYEGVQLREPA